MVIVFALLAALSNAVNEATQHIASTAAPRRSSGWRLVVYLFRSPLWLFGWVALGVVGMFTRWPVYALTAGSVAALFLMQAALHVGPLRASQPFIVIVDPIVSIALSVWLFSEHFTSDGAVLALAAAGFAVMCAGVVVLTQTAPATMKADMPK